MARGHFWSDEEFIKTEIAIKLLIVSKNSFIVIYDEDIMSSN